MSSLTVTTKPAWWFTYLFSPAYLFIAKVMIELNESYEPNYNWYGEVFAKSVKTKLN